MAVFKSNDLGEFLSRAPIQTALGVLGVVRRALVRLWGRDVMLYVGGVSFFALLAVFPAVAILIGLYSLMASPAQGADQAEAIAHLMPLGAQGLFQDELTRLAMAPRQAVTAQSVVAFIVGVYAAHRGFKALLAGLSFIHEDVNPRGFVGFNIMALVVALAAFALLTLISAAFLTLRVIAGAFDFRPLKEAGWIYSEWTWASLGLTLGLTLIYRYAMARNPVGWRASGVGGAAAAAMSIAASWASAFYVEQIAQLGATYGSISAVVIFLIWLSWNVNAVFFGGALATEMEFILDDPEPEPA